MKWSNDLLKFIFSVLVLYILGLVVYESFLLPKTQFDEYLIHSLVVSAEAVLHLLGYSTAPHQTAFFNTIQLESSIGVWVSPNCDGWMVMWVFFSVWLFLPITRTRKYFMLPLFLICIEGVNLIRIVCLSIITKYFPQSLAFNHDYTFTIFVYGFVIFLWWWGVKKWTTK